MQSPQFFSVECLGENLQFTIHIFFRTAVLRKLFDIRFSYKHYNLSRVCPLVKMASKTVTRSIGHSPFIKPLENYDAGFTLKAQHDLKRKKQREVSGSKEGNTQYKQYTNYSFQPNFIECRVSFRLILSMVYQEKYSVISPGKLRHLKNVSIPQRPQEQLNIVTYQEIT